MSVPVKNALFFALVFGLIISTGFTDSWNVALNIFNMGLISAIMALGVNMQWGYAGLFNIGVMGFVALGGLGAVIVSMPPVNDAWAAGGLRVLLGLIMGAMTIIAAILFWKRVPPGRARTLGMVAITWIIVAGLAVIAGVLYGLDKSFKPFTYFQLLLPIFASAIVGGLGNPIGAIVGGFVIAFSEVTVTYAFKKVANYLLPENMEIAGLAQLLSTDYKFAVSFGILLIVLLFRPTGIMKGKAI